MRRGESVDALDRKTFRSSYALEGPDTGVLLPSWMCESIPREGTPDSSRAYSDDDLSEISTTRGLQSVLSHLNFRPSGQVRAQSVPPPARWWLHEPKSGMQSMGKGLFEIVSGIVLMYCEPTAEADTLGSLRSGTRFYATPRQVNGSTWLQVQTRGAPPPIFSLGDAEFSLAKTSTGSDPHITERLYNGSCRTPLVKPAVGEDGGAWIEYNKQYIFRIRDVGRERGAMNYSTLSLRIHSPKRSMKHWLTKRSRRIANDPDE